MTQTVTSSADSGWAGRLQQVTAKGVSILEEALFWFASGLLLFLVAALFLQVFFRYVVGQPLAWSEEGARIALVWFSMTAACIAAIEGQHFVFRWGTLAFSSAWRFWLRRIIDVVIVAVLLLVLKLSVDYLDIVAGQVASGTGLNMRVPYGAISFGVTILILVHLAELIGALLSIKTGQILSVRERNEAEMMEHLHSAKSAEEN